MDKKLIYTILLMSILSVSFALAVPANSGVSETVTETTARFVWTSGEVANASVNYGITTNLGTQTVYTDNLTASHDVTITGLTRDTTYFYNVTTTNSNGTDIDGVFSFTTTDPAISSDLLSGLPSAGSNMGGFMKNIANGVGVFLLIIGLFGAIIAIVFIISKVVTSRMKQR